MRMRAQLVGVVLLGATSCMGVVESPTEETGQAAGTGGSRAENTATGGAIGSGLAPGSGGSSVDPGLGSGGQPGSFDGGASDAGAMGSGGAGLGSGSGGAPATGTGSSTLAVCTSKAMWTGGNNPTMRPGNTCQSCHSFTIAGTIYPTANEPTNCNGINGSTGVKVVITGADGRTLTLTPTASGNFYSSSSVKTPYTARITNGGATRAMAATQASGNCNSCHSQRGANGAPGRIMVP